MSTCKDCIFYLRCDAKNYGSQNDICYDFKPNAEYLANHSTKKKTDAVNPDHYKQGGIECIDALKAALGDKFIGFLIGNVMKYCWRYQHKNGIEDCRKAAWYLDRAIKELEASGNDEDL